MVEKLRGRTDEIENRYVSREYPERFTKADVENLLRLFRNIAIRTTAKEIGLKL